MKNLFLVLLFVPFLNYGQIYEVTDRNVSSSTYGETSTYEVRSNTQPTSVGSFPVTVPDNQQSYDQSAAIDNAIEQGKKDGAVGAAIGNSIIAKYGDRMIEQRAREGIKYLGKGKYELIEVLGTGLTSVKGSIKRANKTLKKFIEKVNLSSKNNYIAKKYSEEGKKGGIGVYSEATIVFELVDKSGNIFIDKEQEVLVQEKKAIKEVESNKIKKENAVNEIKKFKELFDLGIITKEEYDKKALSLKKTLLGN